MLLFAQGRIARLEYFFFPLCKHQKTGFWVDGTSIHLARCINLIWYPFQWNILRKYCVINFYWPNGLLIKRDRCILMIHLGWPFISGSSDKRSWIRKRFTDLDTDWEKMSSPHIPNGKAPPIQICSCLYNHWWKKLTMHN